jgi:thymidine kinase
VRDSLNAINGIGHAAIATDPAFRAALAAHGFSLDAGGEIVQLAPYVGAFSQRAAQIGRNIDRYEAHWRTAHPGQEPGPGLARTWDARAWAEQRPEKITPEPGAEVHHRWLGELTRLGYRDPDTLFEVVASPVGVRVGELDREHAVAQVLARLGAGRSAWNAADIRGEVEQLIARTGVVTEAAVRVDLAEDLTARALERCVPLLHRDAVPAHIRALTSQHVLDVEDDIAGRLAVRGAEPGRDVEPALVAPAPATGRGLDAGQSAAVAALAGDRSLVLVEGAAGAGKTTTLSATRELLTAQGHALVVVTPTLKAAKAARVEVGARAGSAAWLAFQHGWRWDQHGTWTRLAPGQPDPVTGRAYEGPDEPATLRAGDQLVVDEAGMLDQDTARALLTIADEHRVRVAFLGDRHQLSAVGRGGVLDLAARWADPEACLTLDTVHRFTRETATADGTKTTVPDIEYAELTMSMRVGERPEAVFDALHARDQIRIHPNAGDLQAAVADTVATQHRNGHGVAVVVDTREQVAELNAAIRDRLITTGLVDDTRVVTTRAGQRIGAGDTVATRRNDRDLDVANRDTWRVTGAHRDGRLRVTSPAGDRVLPADYVEQHVELAYASTAHGAQGGTAGTAHVVLGEHTGAASAYVGMTRGRHGNTAHLVADNLDDAREQWAATFARDRADLGPAAARQDAARAAAGYAQPRPLDDLLAQLHEEWGERAEAQETLDYARPRLDGAITAYQHYQAAVGPALARTRAANTALTDAQARLATSRQGIERDAERIAGDLRTTWTSERSAVQTAAQRVQAGTGRFGCGCGEVDAAQQRLQRWQQRWAPVLGELPQRFGGLVPYAAHPPSFDSITEAITDHAQDLARSAHPNHRAEQAAAEAARTEAHSASNAHHAAFLDWGNTANDYADWADPDRITRLRQRITDAETRLTTAQQRITDLETDAAITTQPDPPGWLATHHTTWRIDRDTEDEQRHQAALAAEHAAAERATHDRTYHHSPSPSQHIDRHGPSIGR